MKSKTSCYEPALGRMELRRFAPAFALYAVGLFLLTMNILGNELSAPRACEYTSQFASMMAPINLAYAVGVILFGPVPGLLADWTGSYIPAYLLFAALLTLAVALVRLAYARKKRLTV